MLVAMTSRPAAYGARPPPMNRTNPYAADATGRATGETVITAWVVIVLFTPMNTPETITATMSPRRSVVHTPITATTTAKQERLRYMVLASPSRSFSHGAPNTAKMATMTPQPVNTRPSLIGVSFIGNGAYPR